MASIQQSEETNSEVSDSLEINFEEDFEEVYGIFHKLDTECSEFTKQFQDYRKQAEAQTLEEQEFYPKVHAIPWFKRHALRIPCTLQEFMEEFLRIESQKERICSEERTLELGKQGRALFCTEKAKVTWMEALGLLQNVFE